MPALMEDFGMRRLPIARVPNHSPRWEITQLITKWKQEPQKKILIVRANGIRAVKERSIGKLHEGEYYANLSGNCW